RAALRDESSPSRLLREQGHARPMLFGSLSNRGRQVGCRMPLVQNHVWHVPGLQDWLREDRARVGSRALLTSVVTAHADNEEERELQIVDQVPKRVACLEKAGALYEHDRSFAAQAKAAGDGNRLALATDAN